MFLSCTMMMRTAPNSRARKGEKRGEAKGEYEELGQFIENKHFSSLDLVSGYHQIQMDKGSVEVTAFSTGDILYQFKQMPLGVSNGPATLSHLVQSIILSRVTINVAQAYLDDIIVAGESFEDHLANLECMFSWLSEHGLKLNVGKREFLKPEVSYLDHVVSTDGIELMHSNVQAILDFPSLIISKVESFQCHSEFI